MKKILLIITVIISTICLISCSDKDNSENKSKVKDNVMSEEKSDFVLKWYWCKDGERILYRQDLEDFKDGTTNYGDTMAYIVTEKMLGETYLLLCKNSNHTGYSWEYPIKFDIETGKYIDVFADATINNESVKNYEYLKNWEFASEGMYVDYNKEFLEPESQVWNRQIIIQTSGKKIYKQSELNFDNANAELKN